jgi:ElaB protein
MTAKADNDSLRATLRNLVSDSETLLAELGVEGTRRYRDSVTALQRELRRARDNLDDLHYSSLRRAKMSIRRADDYVHENPWRSATQAAAAGILIGALLALLLSRK